MFKRIALLTFFFLAACAPSPAAPPRVDPSPAPVFTAIPTLTQVPPDAGPPETHAGAENLSFDFADDLCKAEWMNSGQNLGCPMDPAVTSAGYVTLGNPLDLNLKQGAKVLVTYPAQNDYAAIFGRYPAYTVNPGDQFHAYLGCLPAHFCDVEFSLEYYDQQGKYHDETPSWSYKSGEPLTEAILDLVPMAGQTVEFVLVVRPQSNKQDAWAVWIDPRIIKNQ